MSNVNKLIASIPLKEWKFDSDITKGAKQVEYLFNEKITLMNIIEDWTIGGHDEGYYMIVDKKESKISKNIFYSIRDKVKIKEKRYLINVYTSRSCSWDSEMNSYIKYHKEKLNKYGYDVEIIDASDECLEDTSLLLDGDKECIELIDRGIC